jgi:hypothetical protein
MVSHGCLSVGVLKDVFEFFEDRFWETPRYLRGAFLSCCSGGSEAAIPSVTKKINLRWGSIRIDWRIDHDVLEGLAAFEFVPQSLCRLRRSGPCLSCIPEKIK